jgi:hypothetical protein
MPNAEALKMLDAWIISQNAMLALTPPATRRSDQRFRAGVRVAFPVM